jgi:hypothetical protein
MAKDKKVNITVTYFTAINYEWHIFNKLVVVQSAVRLTAIMLSVVAPSKEASSLQYIQKQNPFFSTKFYLKDFVKKFFSKFSFFFFLFHLSRTNFQPLMGLNFLLEPIL